MRRTASLLQMLVALAAILAPGFARAVELPSFSAPPLLVFPSEDGVRTILEIVGSARQSIDVVARTLDDDEVGKALAAAARRGVRVNVMLEKYPKGPGQAKQDAAWLASTEGIFTRWANPAFRETQQHTIVVDGEHGYVSTLDFAASALRGFRGFVVRVLDPREVKEMREIFEADWNRSKLTTETARLSWAPVDYRNAAGRTIREAEHTLSIYAHAFEDGDMVRLLGKAVERGVTVRALVGDGSGRRRAWITKLAQKGVRVRIMKAPHLRANAIVADAGRTRATALVGSVDFATRCMDECRGVAIRLTSPDEISRLEKTFLQDYAHAE